VAFPTVHEGKRAAQAGLAKLVTEVEGGRVVASHPVTLGELIERWLFDTAPNRTHQGLPVTSRTADGTGPCSPDGPTSAFLSVITYS
jgi:hypothetical protein